MEAAARAILASVKPGVTPWPVGTCNCAKALALVPRMLHDTLTLLSYDDILGEWMAPVLHRLAQMQCAKVTLTRC
jgi:hypothetical protein